MKKRLKTRLSAIALCLAMILTLLPTAAFADQEASAAGNSLEVTEGDLVPSFAPAGSSCISEDPAIAWVDEDGTLRALKEGTTTISITTEEGTSSFVVTVQDYTDGSPVVGNLKILARFNDSMEFYDGHVYLLFTSYQDGLEINAEDLYGAYQLSDQYYADITADISSGSNHTGNDTNPYFTFTKDLKTMTLNRGEIVTMGMYRDFDLTVPEAALGSIVNSSVWQTVEAAGKKAVVETIFQALETRVLSFEEAIRQLTALFEEIGLDPGLIDGYVTGGVCFNRELYNQKLEWDQYENVTYELDITQNQLDALTSQINGNLNKFSIFSNSCATLAIKAWNAAVGTIDGADSAYKLSAKGTEGIFTIMDAPKTVKDNIMKLLPGYYLNNAENVAEPDAGFIDETGCVYVSAPEKVTAVNYVFNDSTFTIDTARSDMTALVNAAKAGTGAFYTKEQADIPVSISKYENTVNSISFNINGQVCTLDETSGYADGVWFKTAVDQPENEAELYVTDAEGNVLPSVYEDGFISFYAAQLPATYVIHGGEEASKNILHVTKTSPEDLDTVTEVYIKNGDEKTILDTDSTLTSGTKVYVRAEISQTSGEEQIYIVNDILLNGSSIMDSYDAEEGAYCFEMPAQYAKLFIDYEKAELTARKNYTVQVVEGETINVCDCAKLLIGDKKTESNHIFFELTAEEDLLSYTDETHKTLKAEKVGNTLVCVTEEHNPHAFTFLQFEILENTGEYVSISFSDNLQVFNNEEDIFCSFSGYLVKKGTVLNVSTTLEDGSVISSLTVNGEDFSSSDPIVADTDLTIEAAFKKAEIKGMPETIRLGAKGDTYQLNPQVKYRGFFDQFLPVWGSNISYFCLSDLVSVDENGLITVVGDVPEEGASVVVYASETTSSYYVEAQTKVILGEYAGQEIVGNLTISARPVTSEQLIAHGVVTFTPFEDMDLNISYYDYFEPNEKYYDLMEDYEAYPEKYASDPALYSEELVIEDRESYFNDHLNDSYTEPQTFSLKAGQSISLSNYGYGDQSNIDTVKTAFLEGSLKDNENVRNVIAQYDLYHAGEPYDVSLAFDSIVNILGIMYVVTEETGHNPADGINIGGLTINREIYNQFRRPDSQMPNNFFTVDITADQLARLEAFLADPQNNYYSLFNKNCASGSVDLWNTALSDRADLQLNANITGIAKDPQSLYIELGLLRTQPHETGFGGTNTYPRDPVKKADYTAVENAIDEIPDLTYCTEASVAALKKVIDSIDWNVYWMHQTRVDEKAEDIRNAVAGLEYINGWELKEGVWYYYHGKHELYKGWLLDNGKWYYLDPETGAMHTGWVYDNGNWYFLYNNGAMATGWVKVKGFWYFLFNNGAMAHSEWWDGYWLSANGAWTYQPRGSWKRNNTGWWYGDTSGWYAKNETCRINGAEYVFNASGYWVEQ